MYVPDEAASPSRTTAAARIWQRLDATSLRWSVGAFFVFLGAFALVVPHQFRGPVYTFMEADPRLWGLAAAAAGGVLLASAAFRTTRFRIVAAHLIAAGTFFVLASGFARAGGWTGVAVYLVMGVAVAAAATAPAGRVADTTGDLLALAIGVAATAAGVVLVSSQALPAGIYPSSRPELFLLGCLLAATGVPLAAIQGWAAPRPLLVRAVHLAAGGVLALTAALIAWPARSWTGLAFYGGFGLLVALLPWLRRGVRRFDPASISTRFALLFAAMVTAALVLTVSSVTERGEAQAGQEAVREQQRVAAATAERVADRLALGLARAQALATQLDLETPETAADRLAEARLTTGSTAYSLFGPAGEVLVHAGDPGLSPARLEELASDLAGARDQLALQPIRLLRRPSGQPSLLLIAARSSADRVLVLYLDAGELLAQRRGDRTRVRLLDTAEQLVAGWGTEGESGRDDEEPESRIAASAPVPELGWTVVVEAVEAEALAEVLDSREKAFLLLLLVAVLAVTAGATAAGAVVRPLRRLADAVEQLSAGNPEVPLPPSGLTEVDRLSASFRAMRQRLAERTAERERLADELRQRADALLEADRRKNEFLAMLSHELRNPMGAISNAALLIEQVAAEGDPRVMRAAEIITRQSRHLARLVDDLLDVSRITRGKIELRREPLDLRAAVQQGVEANRPLLARRHQELTLDLSEEPLPVEGDLTRLAQVVSNLVRNACQYTPEGGSIRVEGRRDDGGGVALVRVIDDGEGIEPALLPHVFDLFSQGERSLDRSEAGLGIGLTLVQQMVEMHGGTVAVESEGKGRGSTFEVRLPVSRPSSP